VSTLLLEHLIDDAALFPPGNAPMVSAVAGHRMVKAGPIGWLVGRFLCPASRVGELRAQLQPADTFALGLIGDTGVSGLPAAVAAVEEDPRLKLLAVELVPPAGDLVSSVRQVLDVLPEDVRGYVELPRQPDWLAALAVVGAAQRGAKLRTGGAFAGAFPSEREVADFLLACAVAAVPFKCTAGLHNAVRHTDPETGFEHHGFVNIALAACAAVRGEDPEPVLAERDAPRLTAAVRALDDATVTQARALYAGFGSCSVGEPAGDLLDLGLLDGGPA